MRRLFTALLIVAIAAITTAALVDVFIGGSGEPGSELEPAIATSPTTTAPLPGCDRGQLALELEVLGGTNAVSLRHVDGPPCQAVDLTLRVYVTTHGRRSEIPLGDESVLDGVYASSVERSVPFSICRSGSGFTAEAIAGHYKVSREVQPGGENCEGAIREVSVDFGPQPDTKQFRVTPLDPVTHTVSFLIDLPRRTDVRVTAKAGSGPFLEVLDRTERASCRHIAERDSCLIDYGLLGEGARDQWTVFVHKRSQGRAHISFAISFIGVRG
jgi:hypothetical protein